MGGSALYGTSPFGITTDAGGNVYLTGDWHGGSNNFRLF